jgi:serine/threonine protein kinase
MSLGGSSVSRARPESRAEVPKESPGSSPGGVVGPLPADHPTVIARRDPLPAVEATPAIIPRLPIPGEMLGHFRIDEFIGGGGMGRVFRAWDVRLERPVALKILPPEQANEPEIRARFLNEARSAAKLVHPGFALVYEAGEENGLSYIAFEFIEGINLRTLVEREGPLPIEQALEIVLQVAQALAHAARKGVVHRDIKPSNILLTPDGQAKLIDLGLARIQIPTDGAADLTASGVTLGTFDYISPEQARNPRAADQRSDIYSLGCTLFYLLTGQPPYPGGNVLQKLLQHQGEPPPDVRKIRPGVPPEVARLLFRMMAKRPEDRFQTAEDLAAEVRWLLDRMAVFSRESFRPDRKHWISIPPRLRVHLPWLVPVVVLVVAGWILFLLWGASPKETPEPEIPAPKLVAPSQ